MSTTQFLWAQDKDANVKEPIRELSQKGWQHRDIPKASNMNWIFKQISEEFIGLRKDFELHTASLTAQLQEQAKTLYEQKATISTLKKELNYLSEHHARLKSYTQNGLAKASRDVEFNDGIIKGLCARLLSMEQAIRNYHPNFPKFHWPFDPWADAKKSEANSD